MIEPWRRGGMSMFAVGLIAIAVVVVGVYLAFAGWPFGSAYEL